MLILLNKTTNSDVYSRSPDNGKDLFKADLKASIYHRINANSRTSSDKNDSNNNSLTFIQRSIYKNGEPAWLAKNPFANVVAYFYEDGPIIAPKNTYPTGPFKINLMQITGVEKSAIPARAIITVSDNKIEYKRGILKEWYINHDYGLEHGAIINHHESFLGQNSISVLVMIEGDPDTQSTRIDRTNVSLHTSQNGGLLNYRQLIVRDANGNQLPAEFRIEGNGIYIDISIVNAEFPITVDPLISSNWIQKGSAEVGESYGLSVASVGDVTGNGYDDVLVADPYAEQFINQDQTVNRGTVFLYEGSANGLSLSPIWSFTETELNNAGTIGANFGYAIAPAGDINLDGFNDFIISAPTYSTVNTALEGRVYVYLGTAGGVSNKPFTVDSGGMGGTNFGNSVAAADVNFDQWNDLIVGDPNYSNPLASEPDEGRVLVYLANKNFNPNNPQSLYLTPAHWEYESNSAAVGFGTSVANAGDVDGDNYEDIIIGAPGYTNGQATEGAVYIFYGSPTGIDSNRTPWLVESNQIAALLGVKVAGAGDVNNDNIDDVIISARGWDGNFADQGIAYLYLGVQSTGPSTSPAWSYTGTTNSATLNPVAAAGDVNGDGYGDVVIGVPNYANSESQEGRALVFEGISSGLKQSASWDYESNTILGQAGFSVAGGGDFDNDGYSDIVVGAPGITSAGSALVFQGRGNSDLEIKLTDSVDPVSPGTNFTYTLHVTNYGPDPAKRVEVVDTLPTGTVIQSVNADVLWNCVQQSLIVKCSADSLVANALSSSINITVKFPNTEFAITNNVTIDANIIDPDTSNNSDSENTQINTPPVANNLDINTDEDTNYNATQPNQYLPGSDSDNDNLTFSINQQASKGVAVVQANGAFSYQPNSNINGTDMFTYSVSDGIVSDSGSVNITINAVNDAPIAVNENLDTLEDTEIKGTLKANDVDSASANLSFSLKQKPIFGTAIISSNGDYSYIPNKDAYGSDEFRFSVVDDAIPNAVAEGVVAVSVLPVNDAPVAISQSITSEEDIAFNGQLAATDVETPNQLTFSAVPDAGPSKGNVVILASGSFTYTPLANETGSDSFDFKVSDAGSPPKSSTATIKITISNTNDAPVAEALIIETDEDTPVSDQFVATDLETPSNELVFSLDVAPTKGSVEIESNGLFTYSPLKDYAGPDSFKYKVNDNHVPSNSSTATVSVTIKPINDPPIALNGNINIKQNEVWGAFLLGKDAENNLLTYSLNKPPGKGTVEIYDVNNGGFTYSPNNDATGIDSFSFRVFDGNSYSDANNSGIISVFINAAGSGNIDPSIPTLILPDDNETNINSNTAKLSWQASVDPDGDSLTYQVALCEDDPGVTCPPVPVNNQIASINQLEFFTMGSSGASIFLIGLLGYNRRKYLHKTLVLMGVVLLISACSNAAEQAQNSVNKFVKGAPVTVTHLATNLQASKTYYWKIVVKDGNGGTAQSQVRRFTTRP